VLNQNQGLGWERRSGGVVVDPGMRGRRGAQGTIPYPSRDGGEGGEEAVHMPTGVTYVTEKHFFLVKGTLLALLIIRGVSGRGGDEERYGPGRG